MPQATIKLQQAPTPATLGKKPSLSASLESLDQEDGGKIAHPSRSAVDVEVAADNAPAEIPMPFLIAAALLSLVAFGIQIWTFLS